MVKTLRLIVVSLSRNARLLWVGRSFNPRRFQRNLRLAKIYHDLDTSMMRFRQKTGLNCIKGCGRCCENVYVETSVTEVLPLAAELLRRNTAHFWIKRFSRRPDEGQCPFYHKDPVRPGQGRCRIYHLRPLICRMFGFVLKKKKDAVEVLTCADMKKAFASQYAKANVLINRPQRFPRADHYRGRISEIALEEDSRLYPLSEALERAVHKLDLESRYR